MSQVVVQLYGDALGNVSVSRVPIAGDLVEHENEAGRYACYRVVTVTLIAVRRETQLRLGACDQATKAQDQNVDPAVARVRVVRE